MARVRQHKKAFEPKCRSLTQFQGYAAAGLLSRKKSDYSSCTELRAAVVLSLGRGAGSIQYTLHPSQFLLVLMLFVWELNTVVQQLHIFYYY